jgi:RNA polymerase sigma factor (sigma-70 family)
MSGFGWAAILEKHRYSPSEKTATSPLLACIRRKSRERTAVEVSALKAPVAPALRSPSPLLRLQSDERLIALIRRGQHAAFETLFSRYQSRLLAFCRHMLGSKEDAEDVLQEVFVAAFNAILADEREINVRPWLYRIARNRSLNHLRRASAIGVDSMDTHFAEGGISTAEKVMRRESFRQLIGDVQQLPETQRTALLLREIDALSYEQISDAMETTVPAVKSLLVRARISLAEAAEARRLTCDEARLQMGEVAEGLVKTSPAVRRHVRDCERCRAFRKQLKDNNVALAAIFPVGPLLLLKKLVLTKLGSTAGAGGAHVAGASGAGAAATATAAGSASAGGGLLTAGVGALATKAAAGLAVAAIVTAGTVEADHATTPAHHHHHAAVASRVGVSSVREPVAQHAVSQTVTFTRHSAAASGAGNGKPHLLKKAKAALPTAAVAAPVEGTRDGTTTTTKPVTPPVTEVTTDSTQLPTTQTQPSEPATPAEAGETGAPAAPTTETSPTTTTPPPPPPPPAPEAGGGSPQTVTTGSDPTTPGVVDETLEDGGTPAP